MAATAENPRSSTPRWIPALAAVIAVGWLLWLLRTVLTPVLGALLIAYMLDPIVDRLERWRIPRAFGIVIVLAGALAVIGLVLLLVLPGVVREFGQFAQELPRHAGNLMRKVEPWLADRGIQTPHSIREVVDQLGVDVQGLASKAAVPAGKILGYLAGGTASVLGALAGLLIIPVFAFYLLYDFDRLVAGIRELVPWRVRPFVVDVAKEIDAVLGQFVRGQLLIMLLLAVLYAGAYSLLGVRLAVPIGIVAGLLSFIPYVGGATALGLALLMCALGGASWAQVGGVVAAYAVIQALEGFVITPRIMEEKVGLSAIWVLLALMVFGELFGFFGVLLAVPAAAVAKIFVVRAVAHYRETPLFLQGGPAKGLLVAEGLADDAATKEAKAEAERPKAEAERPKAESERPRTEPPKAETERPRTEPPKAESERPRTEPPKAESERPRTESERPRTESERPKAESERPKTATERPKTATERPKTATERPKTDAERPRSDRPTADRTHAEQVRPGDGAAPTGESRRPRKRRKTGRG